MTAAPALLDVDDLHLEIDTFDGALKVLDGVSLAVRPGEAVGIVGETGCGKSLTAKSVMRLVPSPPARVTHGAIHFNGRDLTRAGEREMRRLRGIEMAMIFQDPMTYLNPVFTVGEQITDVIAAHERVLHGRASGRRARRQRAAELLARVNLPHPSRQLDAYPHELSGGMRQRVLIAMALAGRPSLLIADEPTTALDVTIQAQVLRLIAELKETLGLAVLMISHDLGVVAKVCQRIVVMYAGTVVEDAPAERLFAAPLHPYTQGLLRAIPRLHSEQKTLESIPGSIPDLSRPPRGCRFQDRCPMAMEVCRSERPVTVEAVPGHRVACHLHTEAGAHGHG